MREMNVFDSDAVLQPREDTSGASRWSSHGALLPAGNQKHL